jgi:hypothetical protein
LAVAMEATATTYTMNNFRFKIKLLFYIKLQSTANFLERITQLLKNF